MRTRQASDELSDLRDDLANLTDDLANLREDVGELLKDAISAGRSRVNDMSRAVQGEIKDKMHQLRQRQFETTSSIQQQLQRHPLVTMSTVFGLGLILGLMLHRSHRSSP